MKRTESAFLRALEDALHEVTPTHPPTKKAGMSFAEWARQFTYEYGPLIEKIADFQARAQFDPELRALSAAAAEVGTIGPDGRIDPRAIGVIERIAQNPHFAELSQQAASAGARGTGVLTLNVEAARDVGVQLGAEIVLMRSYSVGDYTVPKELIARAWYQITGGKDRGKSGTFMPFPGDLSVWFTAPVKTKHLISLFATYIPMTGSLVDLPPHGLRLEVFGWLPEDSAAGAVGPTDVLDHIHGFRLVVEFGVSHVGVGMGVLGRQVTSNGGLQTATFTISPNNLQAGPTYILNGRITSPRNGGQPNRILRAGSDATTLTLTFPKWVFSANSTLPPVQFANDGTGTDLGWQATSSATGSTASGDATADFTFTWVGKDSQAWTQDMKFTVKACSADSAPQSNSVAFRLDNLDSEDRGLEYSAGSTQMSLSTLVLNGVGDFGLKVDTHCTIVNQPPNTPAVAGPLNATTANSATNNDNDWYGIVDPTDPTKYLTIDDSNGVSWWCGYQFRQATTDTGDVCAQYRAVFWKADTSAAEHNYYAGTWQYSLADNNVASLATWSNGATSSGTTLSVFLQPAN
jgi:hypothetical protein